MCTASGPVLMLRAVYPGCSAYWYCLSSIRPSVCRRPSACLSVPLSVCIIASKDEMLGVLVFGCVARCNG